MNIKELIAKHNHPLLAEENGMVYQVWEDGEITLQKAGDILWQRSLHCIRPATDNKIPLDYFPAKNLYNGHAYIFTNEIGAEAVRTGIIEY